MRILDHNGDWITVLDTSSLSSEEENAMAERHPVIWPFAIMGGDLYYVKCSNENHMPPFPKPQTSILRLTVPDVAPSESMYLTPCHPDRTRTILRLFREACDSRSVVTILGLFALLPTVNECNQALQVARQLGLPQLIQDQLLEMRSELRSKDPEEQECIAESEVTLMAT